MATKRFRTYCLKTPGLPRDCSMIWVKMPLRALDSGGQQTDVFGEETEDQLGEKVGDAPRIGIPVAHIVGDQLKGVGGFLGNLLGIAAGVQAFRRLEQCAQPAHDFGIAGDLAVTEGIDLLRRVGEIGVDFPVVDIGDDQKRRIVQVFAVLQQLLVGSVQVFVFVGRFVFDREMTLVKDISATVPAGLCERLLEDKGIAILGFAIAARHLHLDQATDIKKMRLTALQLAQCRVCPFVDEFLRMHRVSFDRWKLYHDAVT